MDQDAEEAEDEGLLASTGRRFGATWQDITGKPFFFSPMRLSTGVHAITSPFVVR